MSETKRPRRLLKIVAVLLLLGLVLLFFAPMIASGPVRSAIASSMEASLQNARVEIGGSSFSWFGSQSIDNLAIHDTAPNAGSDPVMNLSVNVEQSLLGLIFGGANNLVITANGAIHGIVYEDGSTNFEHIMPPPAPEEEEDDAGDARVPGLEFTITALDVTIDDRRTGTPVAFDGATATLVLERGGNSTFTLNAPAGTGVSHGPVEVDLTLAGLLTSDGVVDFAVDRVSGTVAASDLPTSVLSPLVAQTPLDLQRDLGPALSIDARVGGDSQDMTVRAQAQHLDASLAGAFEATSGALTLTPSTVRLQAQPEFLNELAGSTMISTVVPVELTLKALSIPGGSFNLAGIGLDGTLSIPETISIAPLDGTDATIPLSGFELSVNAPTLGEATTINGGWSLGTSRCTIDETVTGFLPSDDGILSTLRADGTISWTDLSLETLGAFLATLPESVTPIIDAMPSDAPMRLTLTTSTTDTDRLAANVDARLPVGDVLASAELDQGALLVRTGAVAANVTPDLMKALPGVGAFMTLSESATIEARLRAPLRIDPAAAEGGALSFQDAAADAPHIAIESTTPINVVLSDGTPIAVESLELRSRMDLAGRTLDPGGSASIRIQRDTINAMLIPAPEAGDEDGEAPAPDVKPSVQLAEDLQATVTLKNARIAYGEGATSPASNLAASLELPRTRLQTANGQEFALRQTSAELTSDDLASGMQLVVNALFPRDGSLAMNARITPTAPAADAPEDAAAPPPTLDLELELAAVPTAFVDALAQMDGLLVDALGNTVNGTITTRNFSPQRGRINASLTTDQGTMSLGAQGRNNTLRLMNDQNLTASLEVTEALRRRLLSGVHPVFKDVKSTSGPIELTISDARIPLDGDLKKLNADIGINVGDATFDAGSFMFAALLFSKQPGVQTLDGRIEPITATIRRGVLTYERFEMQVGDVAFAYNGTINLNNQKVDLNTEVPLGAIVNVFGNVEETEGVVVPLSLRGTINNPKQGVAPDFDLPGLLLRLNLDDDAPGLSELLNIFDRDDG